MLDGVSLDQLRTFIAAAEEGSFSAAGRRLKRAQSVVSQTLANLEGQLRVKLFDRSGRLPALTDQGRALLADARAVAGKVDRFKAQAKSLATGLEPELSVAVDSMFPPAPFIAAVADFQQKFPSTLLRFDFESSAAVDLVQDGRCTVGMVGSWSCLSSDLTRQPLLTMNVPTVVSPRHPLATHSAPVPKAVLAEHIQLVHVDPADLSPTQGSALQSGRFWRLSQLGAKLAFLRAGLGYGCLPSHLIEADLASGALLQIWLEDAPPEGPVISMSTIYRTDSPPGPAGRWFVERLEEAITERPSEKGIPDHRYGHRPPGVSDRLVLVRS